MGPLGWQAKVNNIGNSTSIDSIAVCANAPSAQTFISSGPVPQVAFGFPRFSVFAPDGWTANRQQRRQQAYGHSTARICGPETAL
jgi:hypothetical protein